MISENKTTFDCHNKRLANVAEGINANDYVILIWSGAAWFVVENSGCTVNA